MAPALQSTDQKAQLGALQLNLAAAKQVFAKPLVAQSDVRLRNPADAYLQVAGFRRGQSPILYPNEADQVAGTEFFF